MRALPRLLATLVVALTLIAACTPALAAKRHSHATTQSPPIRTDAQVVAACRWRIRSQIEPTFDAYLNPGDQLVHYFGTAAARVQFDHCMSDFGKTALAAKRHPKTATAPSQPPTFAQAVRSCRNWMVAHGHPYFDAYAYQWSGQDRVQPYGTDFDKYVLYKCLAANGHPVEDVTLHDAPLPPAPPAPAPPTPTRTPLDPLNWPGYRDACVQKGEEAAFCSCTWTKMAARLSLEELRQAIATDNYAPLTPIWDECAAETRNAF